MFNLTAHKLNAIFEATKGIKANGELAITLPYITNEEKVVADNLIDRLKVEGFIVASHFPGLDTIEIVL